MESPLKKGYDDDLLEGSIEGAYLIERYENIKRTDKHVASGYSIRQQSNKIADRT